MDKKASIKTFAVTGANGMIGEALTLKLSSQGQKVVAICRSSIPKSFEGEALINPVQADILNAQEIASALAGVEGVFHVAGFAKPWAKDSSIYDQVNVEGTRNICDACIHNNVKRLVVTASAGIHGPQKNGELISEDSWPEKYYTKYEESKFKAAKLSLQYCSQGLEVNVVSPARVYSPGKVTESNVPARMMHLYLKKHFGLAPLDGSGIGSYVHIDDVVQGHITVMQSGANGEEYLIGGENASYKSFFETLSSITGKNYPVFNVPYTFSLAIGKTQLFFAENFGLQPAITTPWVRRYLNDWGVSSKKIETLGCQSRSLLDGMQDVIDSWES